MLVGFPVKEYEAVNKDGEAIWVSSDLINEITSSHRLTNNKRMNYAPPTWLPKTENPNGGILILDDYNRADTRFLQATMELIDRGQYISWSLPKNWTIILTSNPDNGDYNVNSMDNAQKTRYISFDLGFDINTWAKWAEEEEIDGRGINFVLSYPELLEAKDGKQSINPRSFVTFFNTISGIKDFSNKSALAMILDIAKGCFTTEDNTVGNMFTMFINNNLDKLITPDKMVTGDWNSVKKELEECLYQNNKYRADIGSVLSTRFINYVSMLLDKNEVKTEVIINRILELIDDKNEVMYFSEDLIFNLLKTITIKYPNRVKKLITNPKVLKRILA